MKFYLLIFTITFTLGSHSLWAHGAHVHGAGELNIAVDEQQITIAFESPTESIYGFETEAKTKEQKKAKEEKLSFLRSQIEKVFQTEAQLQCSWKASKVEVVKEDEEEEDHDEHADEAQAEHRSLEAEWIATCKKSPSGSILKIDFGSQFPRLKSLKVNVLKDASQKSSSLKSGAGEVKL